MTDQPENIAQTVAKLLEDQTQAAIFPAPQAHNLYDPLLAAVPKGIEIKDLTATVRAAQSLLKPFARKGTAKLNDLPSLIAWANRFKGDTSALFADNEPGKLSLTCIADYHGAGGAVIDANLGDPNARHCQHRATYHFPLSKKWQAWMAISGKPKSGVEMGQHLEDHILDVIDPPASITNPGIAGAEASDSDLRLIDIARRLEGNYGNGAQLLGMAQSFTVNEAANYTVAHNSTTGEATVQIKSEHIDGTGQPIRVPKLFLIAIPVFEGGPAYRLPVRFQYRKSGGTVQFILSLHDHKHSLDHAFTESTTEAATATNLPLLIGTPEA